MSRIQFLILISLTFIVNCSNLDNQNDQTQLICGETEDKSFAWLHIENAEAFDAILIKNGSAKNTSKTPKSCIAITEEDRDHQLFVRDSATKTLTLSLDLKNLAPGLSSFSLAQNSQNQKLSTQVRCSEPQIFAADKLEIFFKRSPVDIITHPMAEFKIFDLKENLRLQKTFALGDVIPSLTLGLPDGQYRLEMRNFDAFAQESLAGASPEICTLVIDTDLPVTQLKAQSFTAIADKSSAFKLPPGARLEFSTDQDPGMQVYVCLKKRGDEKIQAEACDRGDFKSVDNNLNAPENGAWDLYAFSKDKAGNISPVTHSTLYIYHDALIAEIRALSRTIQLLVDAHREFEAFKNFQKLLAAGKKLTLQMEINEIYWHLLTHFDWASNKNSTVWAQTMPPGLIGPATAVSPYEDAWVSSTNETKGGTYIYRNGALAKIQTPYYKFKFVDTLRMVGLRQEPSGETILDLFENSKVVESRTLKNAYEDIEMDTKHGVFVLLSRDDIALIDINNLDKQQIIPLPESVKDFGPGLKFSASPDFKHYYVSLADHILRIHWISKTIDIYKDPKGCLIKKPEIAPTGDLYYLNYSMYSLDENCKDVYRVSWSGVTTNAYVISESGKKYDSMAIVDIDKTTFLLSSRGQFIDMRDLSGKVPDKILITKASGSLKRHPMYRDVLYFETENSIHLVSFAEKESQFLKSKEVQLPAYGAGRAYFPTRDPSKFLMLDDSEVRIHSFEPQTLGLMEIVSSGIQCTLDYSKKFSLCRKGALEFQWSNHETMLQKMINLTSEVMAWQVLADGEVIFVTVNRELLSWRPDSAVISKIGNINLEGKLKISWFPIAQMFAVHHAIEWGTIDSFYPEKYLGTLPPKTQFYTRKPEGWFASSDSVEGVPLPHYDLPVVLILRSTSKFTYIDVMNRDGFLINTLKACSFENLDLQKDYVLGLALTSGRIMASGSEPYLYTTCSQNIRKFNIYDSTEHAAIPVPDGYKAQMFSDNNWVWLEKERGRKHIMNFRTGLNGDFLDEEIWKSWTKVEWPNGTFYFSETAVISHQGESFTIELRPFFQTEDPFLVGLTRKVGDQTTNSIMKIDPHWMEAQLKKSPLYHVERRGIAP